MKNEMYHTVIDVGTSKTCALIGRSKDDQNIQIIGMSSLPSKGIQKGLVSNLLEVKHVIQSSVKEAESQAGIKFTPAYVGITGSRVSYVNSRATMDDRPYDEPICIGDVEQVIKASYLPRSDKRDRILHVIPRDYSVDGNWGIHNPIGMRATTIEVESHVVATDPASADNLIEAVNMAGVKISNLILHPLASAESILTEDEKKMGVVLVDIGGGTTDVAIFVNGSIWHINVIPVGGSQITRDISIAFTTFVLAAEEAKLKHGDVFTAQSEESESIQVPSFGSRPLIDVDKNDLRKIIKERVSELLNLVLREVHNAGLDKFYSVGLVLTGGTANLPGLQELANEMWPGTVRIGVPVCPSLVPENLEDPAYASSLGLLYWGARHKKNNLSNSSIHKIINAGVPFRKWLGSMTNWIHV
jgi:cell division protein FtsA